MKNYKERLALLLLDIKLLFRLIVEIILIIIIVNFLIYLLTTEFKQSETVANFFSIFVAILIVYCLISYRIHVAKNEILNNLFVVQEGLKNQKNNCTKGGDSNG